MSEIDPVEARVQRELANLRILGPAHDAWCLPSDVEALVRRLLDEIADLRVSLQEIHDRGETLTPAHIRTIARSALAATRRGGG